MAENEGEQQQEKFDFTAEGEALDYIGLDQARIQAIEHARDHTDSSGRWRHRPLGTGHLRISGREGAPFRGYPWSLVLSPGSGWVLAGAKTCLLWSLCLNGEANQ